MFYLCKGIYIMLKRFLLFIFCFVFTVMSYATVQEDSDQLSIGDKVYTIDSPGNNIERFPFRGPFDSVILGVNKNTKSVMVLFVDSMASFFSSTRPIEV